MPEMITVQGWCIETASIETDAETYESAKADDELDLELDSALSNMNPSTFVIEAGGKVLAPYESPVERSPEWVLEKLEPLLDRLPAQLIIDYASSREANG